MGRRLLKRRMMYVSGIFLAGLVLAACGSEESLSDSASDGDTVELASSVESDEADGEDVAEPEPTPKPTDEPAPEPTAMPAPELPAEFSIALSATGETTCGYGDFSAPYDVSVDGETITMLQVDAGVTTSGTYDSASGEFSTSLGGLPGTEIYDGTMTYDGTTIVVEGTYTYIDDPNQACEGLWTLDGETTP